MTIEWLMQFLKHQLKPLDSIPEAIACHQFPPLGNKVISNSRFVPTVK